MQVFDSENRVGVGIVEKSKYLLGFFFFFFGLGKKNLMQKILVLSEHQQNYIQINFNPNRKLSVAATIGM